ncbi:MAG: dihydrolipoyl dehydrogenase [Rickettsiaceae bacterium]
MEQFDLVVIGAGPAGYTGAIRASQLGMKVLVIEKNPTLGGTCLNVGCIPSKALLNISEKYEEAKHHFHDIGINTNVKLDLQKMMARKNKIVSDLCSGISSLFAKNKITKITGSASLESKNIVLVNNGEQKFHAKNILIATGSEVIGLEGIEIDEKSIVSSTGALALSQIPKKMIVVGGGYIGLELGSVWNRLGTEVTVVEYSDHILPNMDKDIREQFYKILQKQGLKFQLSTQLLSAKKEKNGSVSLELKDNKTGNKHKIDSDVVLMSIGRKAYTAELALDKLGISLDKRGCIEINEKYQTVIDNIYAVGDVVQGPMLAHKAEEEAIAAVEIMSGQAGHVNYNLIPSVIYTWPEVASVGLSENQLKEQKIEYKIGKFPFLANSRARANGYTDGMVKILAHKSTDQVLGVHIIGPDAGTLIAEATIVMEFGGAAEDIARTCHAHPTLSEAVKEAALAVDKRTINL